MAFNRPPITERDLSDRSLGVSQAGVTHTTSRYSQGAGSARNALGSTSRAQIVLAPMIYHSLHANACCRKARSRDLEADGGVTLRDLGGTVSVSKTRPLRAGVFCILEMCFTYPRGGLSWEKSNQIVRKPFAIRVDWDSFRKKWIPLIIRSGEVLFRSLMITYSNGDLQVD
ncbi:hypothetical protein FA13DRAFT_1710953 [Coprinellus micaceus]|uniref:Uncharacterized protein n=1 Tax=Coprinellus micaceus TaxID=71717 RepID=A0A4Y7T805_COPMI|nr:hypothetical protein FA13DRAFT_1710953 [Coprinellus micaceus]